jgi:glucose-6-phosphate 1-dehydrogenase
MKKTVLFICFIFVLSNSLIFASAERPPLTVVIFGATGDLAARKLVPALFNLSKEGELDRDFQVVAIGRRDWNKEEFDFAVSDALNQFSRNLPTAGEWDVFQSHLVYQKMNFTQESDYQPLVELLQRQKGDVLFFLATESSFFQPIIKLLHTQGLLQQSSGFSRVIIEKPFGEDFDSALALQASISQYLAEDQIYRMDHYLGKEGLFKLAKFRLEDTSYENILNRNYVSDVQITLNETIGIGTRANFYEKTGHLRDVVQNHAMQVFAFAMMDRPANRVQTEILSEKAKVLEAIRPLSSSDIVRGQYAAGIIKELSVPGYREEKGVPLDSRIETFVEARLFVDNERWAGVPVYIRSGKRLPEQVTQVKYHFKKNPLNVESLTVVVQPNPRILITQNGLTNTVQVNLDSALQRREGYENQILSAIKGDKTGFVALEEALISWRLFTPILQQWRKDPTILLYQAGTWPSESTEEGTFSRIIEKNQRCRV